MGASDSESEVVSPIESVSANAPVVEAADSADGACQSTACVQDLPRQPSLGSQPSLGRSYSFLVVSKRD